MEKSLFAVWVAKYFAPIIQKIVEKINGSTDPLKYRYKTMLSRNYSLSLKWGTLSSTGRAVSADVVAMDSSLPLKSRESIQGYEGDIPKIGMAAYLGERSLSDLDMLNATNRDGSRTNIIIQKLFADSNRVLTGVYERLEYMFLEALSTGYTTVEEDTNTGLAVRLNFGHPASNKFGSTAAWSDPASTPMDDIERILNVARGNGDTISVIMLDRGAWNSMRNNAQVKQLFAFGRGFSGDNVAAPSLSALNEVLRDNHGFVLDLVDRTVTFEKNGKRTVKTPWAANTLVFLTNPQVGELTWGRLAEMNHPAKQVDYTIADEFILVSKFHEVNPLREWTTSQALAIPVINDVDQIYILDTEEATAGQDEQTEGDADFSYKGVDYTKQSVVDALNATGEVAPSTIDHKDSTLAKKIDQLSEEGVTIFEDLIETSA